MFFSLITCLRSPVYAGLKHPLWNAAVCLVIVLCASTGCAHRNKNLSPQAPPVPLYAPLGSSVSNTATKIATGTVTEIETGIASWYGDPYHGRQSASGELFDKEKLTAAHRTLPFQTWVEVTNLENGKRVTVRINDRGPFVAGRIIDLSQAAGREIDLVRMGIARVRLEVIPPAVSSATPVLQVPKPSPVLPSVPRQDPVPSAPSVNAVFPGAVLPAAAYSVEAAAFSERERAELLSARMADKFGDSRVVLGPRLGGPGNRQGSFWRVLVGRQLTQEQARELAARVSEALLAGGAGPASLVAEPF